MNNPSSSRVTVVTQPNSPPGQAKPSFEPTKVTAPTQAPGIPKVDPTPKPDAYGPQTPNPRIAKSFEDLDRLVSNKEARQETTPVKPQNDEPVPESPQKPEAEPDDDSPVKPKSLAELDALGKPKEPTEEKPSDDQIDEPGPKHLRKAYNDLKIERERLAKELEEAKRSKDTSAEIEAVKRELEAAKARYKLLSDEIDYADEVDSPEFRDKWIKPYQEAIQAAQEDITQLARATDDQPGSIQDLNQILQMNRVDAMRRIKELFPDFSDMVYRHYENIHGRWKEYNAKQSGFKQSIQERRAKQAEEAKTMQETFRKQFDTLKGDTEKKFSFLFNRKDLGKDEQAYLEQGYKEADTVLNGDPNLKPEEFNAVLAEAYHKIAHFPRFVLISSKLKAENAELRAKIAKYESSEPATGAQDGRTAGEQPVAQGNLLERTLATLGQKR